VPNVALSFDHARLEAEVPHIWHLKHALGLASANDRSVSTQIWRSFLHPTLRTRATKSPQPSALSLLHSPWKNRPGENWLNHQSFSRRLHCRIWLKFDTCVHCGSTEPAEWPKSGDTKMADGFQIGILNFCSLISQTVQRLPAKVYQRSVPRLKLEKITQAFRSHLPWFS